MKYKEFFISRLEMIGCKIDKYKEKFHFTSAVCYIKFFNDFFREIHFSPKLYMLPGQIQQRDLTDSSSTSRLESDERMSFAEQHGYREVKIQFNHKFSDYDQCLFFIRFLNSTCDFTHRNECKQAAVCKINVSLFQEEIIKMKAE